MIEQTLTTMMSNPVTAALVVTMLITLACSCVCVLVCLSFKRNSSRANSEKQKQVQMAQTAVLGIGRRVLELESKLSALRQSQNDLSHSTQDYAFSKAKSLIAQGMSDDAIAESSGLTLSEINLMKLVHSDNDHYPASAVGH